MHDASSTLPLGLAEGLYLHSFPLSPPVASNNRLIALVALDEDELEDQPRDVSLGFLDPDPLLLSYSAFLSSLPEFIFGPPSTGHRCCVILLPGERHCCRSGNPSPAQADRF